MTDDLHRLSGAYVVDALTDQEREDFEAHLEDCAACRREVDSLREVTPLLAATVAVEPPPALRAELLARIRQIPQEAGATPQEPSAAPAEPASDTGARPAEHVASVHPLRPRWRTRGAALAAAAAVVVGGGVTWQVVERVTTSVSEEVLAAPDAQTWQVSTSDGGRVSVTRSTDMNRAVLKVEDMPVPDRGRAYQAWLQDEQGAMIPAGVMTSTDAPLVLEGDVDAAVGVGVTVEPEGGSPAPTSDPVALIEFG